MNENDGGPAFPGQRIVPRHASGLLYEESDALQDVMIPHSGMSLRDYFAAQALVGIASWKSEPVQFAAEAYAIADAMIAERSKP